MCGGGVVWLLGRVGRSGCQLRGGGDDGGCCHCAVRRVRRAGGGGGRRVENSGFEFLLPCGCGRVAPLRKGAAEAADGDGVSVVAPSTQA